VRIIKSKLLVDGIIGGSHKGCVVIDTGANVSLVDKKTAKLLGAVESGAEIQRPRKE